MVPDAEPAKVGGPCGVAGYGRARLREYRLLHHHFLHGRRARRINVLFRSCLAQEGTRKGHGRRDATRLWSQRSQWRWQRLGLLQSGQEDGLKTSTNKSVHVTKNLYDLIRFMYIC